MSSGSEHLSNLIRTHHRSFIGYAYLLCGNPKDAEDLAQDALIKVFAGRQTRPGDLTAAYVRQAILTIYLDAGRRRHRWLNVIHLTATSNRQESLDGLTSEQIDIAKALSALSNRQRACVVLRYFEDLTIPQIAERLGNAEGTVKRHLFDAHAVLRDLLGPMGEAPPGFDEPRPADSRTVTSPDQFRPRNTAEASALDTTTRDAS